jgi:hypothetical protein
MNVSISQIVADLHTTIQGVQGAITAYTLVMAAFMLVGAKIGDICGRDLRPSLPRHQVTFRSPFIPPAAWPGTVQRYSYVPLRTIDTRSVVD